MLDEDFEWLEPEQTLLGDDHRGLEEVRQAIELQLEVCE